MPGDGIPDRLPRSLESLGTTAPAAEPFRKSAPLGAPEWVADLEYVWRKRVEAPIAALQSRARRRRRQARAFERESPDGSTGAWLRVACLRSAEWAEERARAMAMSRADIVEVCGQRWRSIRCGCTSLELRVGCDQPQLCGACRRRHWQKWRKRITLSMQEALRVERASHYRTPSYRRRGMRPGIYLVTLTAPHSGDLATDRVAMGEAVRKLLKHANKHAWWSTYALTWEATAGDDGAGHMHAHLAVISSWIPYTSDQADNGNVDRMTPRRRGERRRAPRGLHEVWRDAMPGAVVLDVQAPRSGADEAAIGASYLAKYVTKGVDPAEFTGRKAGELLIAFRSKRKVTTSAGFWRHLPSECPHCAQAWRSTGAPCSLQDVLPGAVLRSHAERAGYWIPRGGPQVPLRWSGG